MTYVKKAQEKLHDKQKEVELVSKKLTELSAENEQHKKEIKVSFRIRNSVTLFII